MKTKITIFQGPEALFYSHGTSLRGAVTGNYENLKKVFGPPRKSEDTKTQVVWTGRFPDGVIFTIYDYKQEAHFRNVRQWNIGGHSFIAVWYLKMYLEEFCSEEFEVKDLDANQDIWKLLTFPEFL